MDFIEVTSFYNRKKHLVNPLAIKETYEDNTGVMVIQFVDGAELSIEEPYAYLQSQLTGQ